ncbi:MAG: hypothetical protein H6557_35320 [Lewinellaceae bacterium]|nr:hypothetical protein [Phaeodactylibacter sp.]MCB9041916.1 hypothetical protein [Lewinellaceae bacterium]
MTKGKHFLWAGLALLLLGAVAATMSQMIIEGLLGIEREFGEEPLSMKATRYGLLAFAAGLGLMIYGGWKNKRQKNA